MNVQLANTYNPSKNYRVSSWYASPKLDGVRAVFIPQRGLFTRSNKPLNGFSNMEQSLEIICKQSGLSFIDGELVIKGRSFQASQGVILAPQHADKSLVEFHVFAVGGSFSDTQSMLEALPEDSQHNIFRVNSELIPNTFDAVENACRNFTNKGYEGVMLRNPEINYFEGRSDNLLKYKFFNEADLEIVKVHGDRSVTVQGKINNQDIRCNVRFTGENLIGQFLSVKYQTLTDRPDKEGFYSLRFPSAIGIKSDRDFEEVAPKPKFTGKPSGRLIYHKNGFVEANFQIVFVDKPTKKRLSFIPDRAAMSDWRKQLFRCRTLDEGMKLFAELKLTVPQVMEFAKYLGVKLTGCRPLKAEMISRIVRVSLGAKLIAERFFILAKIKEAKHAMNKSEILAEVRSLKRKLEGLEDMIIAIEEPQQIQPVQVSGIDREAWLTVREVCECLKISQATFYEYIKSGLLPSGFEFGPRSKRWRLADIEAWQMSKQNPPETEQASYTNTAKRRGRVSKIRKVSEFCHV